MGCADALKRPFDLGAAGVCGSFEDKLGAALSAFLGAEIDSPKPQNPKNIKITSLYFIFPYS